MSDSGIQLAIVGYGKMGHAVEMVARESGHSIATTIDPLTRGAEHPDITPETLAGAQVAIEFSTPGAAAANVSALLEAGVAVVCGTTGWDREMDGARQLADDRGVGFVWAPNFSLGVSVLFRLVAEAASCFAATGAFSPWLLEAHHDGKKDGPSGTARRLAQTIVERTPGKTRFGPAPSDRPIDPELLPVSWIRAGTIPGEHRCGWDAAGESFEMIHRARDRRVFAVGAVRAAEWLVGRNGSCTFDEFLDDVVFGTCEGGGQ